MSDLSTIIQAVSSLIIAFLTYSLVKSTKRYVELTKDISSTNAKMVEEQNRPYVVAHIFGEDEALLLSIKNIGNRPAKDVDIIFTPDIEIITQKFSSGKTLFESKPMLKQSFIPPSHEIKNVLYIGQEYFKREDAGQHVFEVMVRYTDEQGKQYQEIYTIDFRSFYFANHIIFYSDNHQLEQTHKEIKMLREELIKALNNRK